MIQTQETENNNLEKKHLKPRQFSDKPADVKRRLLIEIKSLNQEIELLKTKIKIINTTPPKEKLVQVINQITQEIQRKDEIIMNHESIMYARNKEDKLLKQTIKEISKKYADSEGMYEQVSVTLEKCMQDNEKLKIDLIEKKNIIVTKYKFLGICFLTKISD
jgi:hypothetical protein